MTETTDAASGTYDPDPADTTYVVDFVVVLRDPRQDVRIEHDRHVCGVFPEALWRAVVDDAGLELVDPNIEDPDAGEHAVFAARKPA